MEKEWGEKMRVLIFAPHPDDEVIGVGGTIAKRVNTGDEVYVCVVTKGQEPMFKKEFIEQGRKECREADAKLGVTETIFLDFPAVMLETVPRHELNGKISDLIQSLKPEEIFIPHRGDMQLDHQIVGDSVMVAVRPRGEYYPKRVYAYETLSETGWNIPNAINEFIPNVYEDISDTIEQKLSAMRLFQSQLAEFPNARSIGAIEALARFRGATVTVNAAEAFTLVREIKG